jgi:hypothetical protein
MSEPIDPVLQAVRSAERNWYEDGLAILFGSLIFFWMAAFCHILFSPLRVYMKLVVIALNFVLIFIVGSLHRHLVTWAKNRVTYPRTGYSPPPPSIVGIPSHDTGFWPTPPLTPMEAAFVDRQERMQLWGYVYVSLLTLLSLSGMHGILAWRMLTLAMGVFLGLVGKYHLPAGRSSWTALILCLLSGIAAAFSPLPDKLRVETMMFLLGGISITVGAYQLAVFLHRHPRPTSTAS